VAERTAKRTRLALYRGGQRVARGCLLVAQIELECRVLHRKVVNFEALPQRILGFIEHHHRSAKPIQGSYTVEKLEQKFAMN
jgi:hypothetical protein